MKFVLAALTAALFASVATPAQACTVDATAARRTEIAYVMNHEKAAQKIESLGGRLDGVVQTDTVVTVYVNGCSFDARPVYMQPKGMPAACPIIVDIEIENTICGINPGGIVLGH